MSTKPIIPGVDLTGLERFSLSELGQVETSNGQPLDLSINEVEEDPENARTEYDEAEMEELTQSIRADKVREPISVRPKNAEGKYIINSGSRRYRASKRAGKTTIPGFIDGGADEFARFVVNEQRAALTPMDIARFIGRHAALTQAEIAARIGKSREYVTQHAALLKLPEPILALYDKNVCRNATALAELARLYKKAPEVVEAAIVDAREVTGQLLRNIKDAITSKDSGDTSGDQGSEESPAKSQAKKKHKGEGVTMQITVKYGGKTYRLAGEFKTARKPRGANSVYVVKGRDDPISVPIAEIELDSVIFKD